MIRHRIELCLIACLLFCTLSAEAGEYVSIEGADLSSSYPQGRIFLTVRGIESSLLTDTDANIVSVAEDGVPVKDGITVTKQSDARNYLYMVFSIDSSKSISKDFLTSIKSAARVIVQSIGPNDTIALYHFDDRVTQLNGFTRNRDLILRNINSVERHGKKTLLYNSIYDSIEMLNTVEKDNNKKIIVFTDGKDEGSSVRDDDVIELARSSGIPIYFICCKNSGRLKVMARISKMTGGKVVFSNRRNDVAGMYQTLLSIIKSRYIVRYPSRLTQDGKEHTIDVQVAYGDIRDRDSIMVTAAGFSLWRIVPLPCTLLCGIVLLFLILIFIIVLYFMNREKNLLKKNFEVEKKLITESMLRAGGTKVEPTDESLINQYPMEPRSQYAHAWVYGKGPDGIGNKQALRAPEMVIGSDSGSDIIISDELVSQRHAKIKFINGSYYLFDLISDRGTFLNGKKLLRPKALYDWDEITLGNTVLIFRGSIRTG